MPKITKKKTKRISKAAPVTEEIFQVERIIKKKVENGKVYYYLKWIGYEESDNTWEPVDNLDCPELISKFESSLITTSPSKAVLEAIPMNQVNRVPIELSSSGDGSSENKRKSLTKNKAKSMKSSSEKKKSQQQRSAVVSPVRNTLSSETSGDLEDGKQSDDRGPKYTSGFAKNWEAEEILGATEDRDQILFLMKWSVSNNNHNGSVRLLHCFIFCRKGIDDPELVYAYEANSLIPQMVIKFYESKLSWHEPPTNKDSS